MVVDSFPYAMSQREDFETSIVPVIDKENIRQPIAVDICLAAVISAIIPAVICLELYCAIFTVSINNADESVTG